MRKKQEEILFCKIIAFDLLFMHHSNSRRTMRYNSGISIAPACREPEPKMKPHKPRRCIPLSRCTLLLDLLLRPLKCFLLDIIIFASSGSMSFSSRAIMILAFAACQHLPLVFSTCFCPCSVYSVMEGACYCPLPCPGAKNCLSMLCLYSTGWGSCRDHSP